MTAHDLERAVRTWCMCRSSSIVIPRVYLLGSEQDVVEITTAGYAVEYEIKLSAADFYADRRKWIVRGGVNQCKKHDALARRVVDDSILLPRRFWFVMPESVQVKIPEYAGLLVATSRSMYPDIPHLRRIPVLERVRQAPVIRGARKVTHNQMIRLLTRVSGRYWHLRDMINQQERDSSLLSDEVEQLRRHASRCQCQPMP